MRSATFSGLLVKRITEVTTFVVALLIFIGSSQRAHAADEERPLLSTLRQISGLMINNEQIVASFRVEGVVCAISRGHRTVVLQDDSAAVMLELPPLNQPFKPGDNIVLEGTNCPLTRGAFAIQVGTSAVVDDDGSHPIVSKSGQVFLDAGLMPLRVEWFNSYDSANLQVEYAGPSVARTKIPESVLYHKAGGQAAKSEISFKPGLEYITYVGNDWQMLPDFRKIVPAGHGITSGFDISRRARPNECAMVFTGYLKISKPGVYTFYVASDDGCRLFAGDASAHYHVFRMAEPAREANVNDLSESPSEDGNPRWSQLEGKVHSVRAQPGLAELQIDFGQRLLTADILDLDAFAIPNLLGATIKASGIYQQTRYANEYWPARLVVPGVEYLQILTASNSPQHEGTLTSVGQIRALSWQQIQQRIRVHIRGVVTMANYISCVLQDASGGIYLPYNRTNWVNQPRPGEIWEFNGVTDAGEFSPVVIPSTGKCLGYAALPQGIRPTWSEFQDGSLDADEVDIEAAVVEVSKTTMSLLTRDGMVTLHGDIRRPLPSGPHGTPEMLLGSVVRLRGVYTAAAKGMIRPRQFLLGNVFVSVIEAASTNWLAGPTTPIRDLLKFRSPTADWGRVKVAGVVLHSEPRAYILSDSTSSIRVYTREPQPIEVGDWVEAAGYPQFGGPSPTLLEAQARKTGNSTLPKPAPLTMSSLPNRSYDASLVQIKALLLSDTVQQSERVLELQAGQNHFLAKLRIQPGTVATLRPGSLVQLTGVYSSLGSPQDVNGLNAFELLLNHPSNIAMLRQAPWWTPKRILILAMILAVGLMLALAWAALLRRTVARRTLQLKQETESRQLVEQQRVLEQERARVAQDLHDELGARLAEVGILGTLAGNPDISREKQNRYLHRLAELGRLLVGGLDEIVWAVNPQHDTNMAVSGYLRDYAQDFLQSADIACYIEDIRPWPDGIFNTQDRHQLFLAFREALTNVVKHAEASEVCVRIGGDDQSLWVTVQDNGKGIKPDAPRGDGLINMRNRMKQIGGECKIQAGPEGGTTLTLRVFTNRNSLSI